VKFLIPHIFLLKVRLLVRLRLLPVRASTLVIRVAWRLIQNRLVAVVMGVGLQVQLCILGLRKVRTDGC
jgi:hypothetical protein